MGYPATHRSGRVKPYVFCPSCLDAAHCGAFVDPATFVGRQRHRRPFGARADSTAHPQLFTLGLGVCLAAAHRQPSPARQQPAVDTLAALCLARSAGRGLLQQLAVLGPANLHAHQRDLGGIEHAGVHAGVWRFVFQTSGSQTTTVGRCAVHRGRAAGAVPRRLARFDPSAAGAGRCVCVDRYRLLGLVQLAIGANHRAHASAQQLGLFFNRANGFWPELVGLVHRRRVDGLHRPHRGAHRVGMAAGGRAGLRGRWPVFTGLPLLGLGRATRGPQHRWLLRQPHPRVCRHDVRVGLG